VRGPPNPLARQSSAWSAKATIPPSQPMTKALTDAGLERLVGDRPPFGQSVIAVAQVPEDPDNTEEAAKAG
jgi:hypothetical protein